MISAFARNDYNSMAIQLFEVMMMREGAIPDRITFIHALSGCISHVNLVTGKKMHVYIIYRNLDSDIITSTSLISMYDRCGSLTDAREVFHRMPIRNVVTWNALISGYAQHGYGKNALVCFECMKHEGISPQPISFVCALKACASIRACDKGRTIHLEIIERDFLGGNVLVSTTLVDMYAKCGELSSAKRVFNALYFHDVATWNALIAGYVDHGQSKEALDCYTQMRCKGLLPDPVTFVCILKACGSIGEVEKGHELHDEIVRQGLHIENASIGNALVDMYAKCGEFSKAQDVLDNLPAKDSIAWNAIITSYVRHGHDEEALDCFHKMQRQCLLLPDAVTYISILKACGHVGATCKGQEIHDEITREGLLDKSFLLSTALVDMYAKCGALLEAQEIFDEHPVKDVVSWNVLMAGYAQLGKHDIIFHSLDKMIVEGVPPDTATFTIILNACSHSGLLEKGQIYFETMNSKYGLVPTLEHHTCMVGLFGRAGHFNGAEIIINGIPFLTDLAVWHTVLSACKKWGNVGLGKLAFGCATQLDVDHAASYVYMGDIYAADGGMED